MTKKTKNIPGGTGVSRTREITIHVPVGLRYQTTKLFTDGGYDEVETVAQEIDPFKALSKDLGRTMPDFGCEPWLAYNDGAVDTVPGYSLTFAKGIA